MDKKLVFLMLGIFLLSLVSAYQIQNIPITSSIESRWNINQSGNEINYDITLAEKVVDVSNTWNKILTFLGLSEKEYEAFTTVEICSQDTLNKTLKLKQYTDGWEVQDKDTEDAIYFIYNNMPVKDKDGNEIKTLSKEIKENIKESIKIGEKYCYYDLIPKDTEYIKYGDNSIIITPSYTFSTQAMLNNTRIDNGIHLDINATSEREIVFDGDTDYASLENTDFMAADQGTVCYWVNFPNGHDADFVTREEAFIFKQDGLYFFYNEFQNDGRLSSRMCQNTPCPFTLYTVQDNWTANEWYSICSLWGIDGNKIYVNGVGEANDSNTSSLSLSSTTDISLGQNGGGSNWLNGSMDEFMVFSRALSSSEILNYYNLNRSDWNGSTIGLTADWTFDNNPNNYNDEIDGKMLTPINQTTTEIDTAYPSNTPWSSLSGYWNFDGDNSTEGTAHDMTNLDKDGTYNLDAHVSNTSGIYGDYLSLDGTGDYVLVDLTPSPQNTDVIGFSDVTFSGWFRHPEPLSATIETIMGYGANGAGNYTEVTLRGSTYNGMYLRMGLGAGALVQHQPSTNLSATITDGEWHHFAYVLDRSENLSQLYFDGVFDSNLTDTDISQIYVYSTFHRWRFGASVYGGTVYYYNGSIDELMTFNKALTQSEITDIYNNQSNRFKDDGDIILKQITLNESQTGYDTVNFTTVSETTLNTKQEGRLGYWEADNGYNVSMDGLVGYWTLDNLSWIDLSVNSNDGTSAGASGDITNIQGIYNNSAYFDGDSQIDLSPLGTNPAQQTVSAWIYLDNDSQLHKSIWTHSTTGGVYEIFEVNGNNLKYSFASVSSQTSVRATTTDAIQTGQWYFVTATRELDDINLYINNIEVGDTESYNSPGVPTPNKMRIGNFEDFTTWDFNGSIDEVMIFDRILSSAERNEIYVKGLVNWNYTGYKELEGSTAFTIPETATNILPEIKQYANNTDGNSSFYTPIVYSSGMFLTMYSSNINFTTNNPSNKDYDGLQSCFNVTTTSEIGNDNVWIELNGTNITMDDLGSNNYGYCQILSGGTYNYTYYANNTYSENSTEEYVLTINKATPSLNITSSESWNLLGATYSTITGEGCPDQLTCELTMEEQIISNPLSYLFAVGYYGFEYSTLGNENYTSYSTTQVLNSQANQTGVQPQNLTGDNTLTIDYADFMVDGNSPETICFKLKDDQLICVNKDGFAN